jgi:hypothetical protein
MPISCRTRWSRALLCTFLAYACSKSADPATTEIIDDPTLTGAGTCTAAGGECVPEGSTRCAHAHLDTQLSCDAKGDPENAWCCLDRFLGTCDKGERFPISASDYDQSCEKDSDCIGIGEGDGCGCLCQNAAINVAHHATWLEDVKRTPGFSAMLVCNCPATSAPRCSHGTCVLRPPGLRE